MADQSGTLKSLHRGEIAATETYVQALQNLGDNSCSGELAKMRDDHREFADELREWLHDIGAEPDQDSGAWGSWAGTVERGAEFLGTTVMLRALQEGEKYGVSCYEEALKEALPMAGEQAIRGKILPRTREHIDALDRLMGNVQHAKS